MTTATVLKGNLERAFICSYQQAVAMLISGYAQLVSAKPFTIQLWRGAPGAAAEFVPASDDPMPMTERAEPA